MKWSFSIVAAALAVSLAPLVARAQTDPNHLKKGEDLLLRGCVQEGAKKGHYVLTHFSHVPAAGQSAMPKIVNGRRVFFWLEDLPKLDKYFNQMVEVKGEFLGLREGKTDPKLQDGQFVLEIEGPGRDVDITGPEAREVVGTTGTLPMPTTLIRVDVDDVRPVAGTCNEEERR